jgi:serine/threonine protein kinase
VYIGTVATPFFLLKCHFSWQFAHTSLLFCSDVPVAVKMLKPSFSDEQLQTFYDEAETIARIPAHENVIGMLGVAPDPFMIVLEFANLGSVRGFLRKCVKADIEISTQQHLGVVRDVACGMAFLATHGIVHRDIAARNVLATSEPESDIIVPKVSDFGLSRKIEDAATEHLSASSVGPAKWMAIESLKKGASSEKSDVWSFAVFAFEVFSNGGVPYGKLSAVEAVRKVMDGARLEFPETCPSQCRELLGRCMREKPEARPTFQQCFDELSDSGLGEYQSLKSVMDPSLQ